MFDELEIRSGFASLQTMPKRAENLSPEDAIDAKREMFREGLQEDAWLKFLRTEKPAALAEYLELGGVVDDQIRSALIHILENAPGGLRGGRNPYRDHQTFKRVNLIHAYDRVRFWLRERQGDPLDGKPMSKRQALKRYADETGQELRRVEIQYKRGEKFEAQHKQSAKD